MKEANSLSAGSCSAAGSIALAERLQKRHQLSERELVQTQEHGCFNIISGAGPVGRARLDAGEPGSRFVGRFVEQPIERQP